MRCATPLKTQHFLPGGFLCGPYKLDLFIKAAGVFHIIVPVGVRSSAVLRFLLCGEQGRTMEYWMSFEDGPGSHRGKGAVLHRVNPYDQPPKEWAFYLLPLAPPSRVGNGKGTDSHGLTPSE